jgi:hypothetical protein
LGDDDSHDDIILGSVLVSIFQVFSTGFRCSVCKTEVSCDVDAVDRHLKTNHGNIVIKNVSRLHTKMISARDRLMKLRLADETQRRSNHERARGDSNKAESNDDAGLGDDEPRGDIICRSVSISVFQVFAMGFRCSVCEIKVGCSVDAVKRHLKKNIRTSVIKMFRGCMQRWFWQKIGS